MIHALDFILFHLGQLQTTEQSEIKQHHSFHIRF